MADKAVPAIDFTATLQKAMGSGKAAGGGISQTGGYGSGASWAAAPKTTAKKATKDFMIDVLNGSTATYGKLDGNQTFTGKAAPILNKNATTTATTTPTTGVTYKDFTKAAKAAGFGGSFDQSDLDLAKQSPEYGMSLIKLKQDLAAATTNEQRLLAQEAINQLKKNYGTYWNGDQGKRTYAASYGSKIGDALDEIGNYGPFDFDPETDPSYASYKKQYNREGDRAAANALATAAAATGGVPSSYAASAAAQAGNYYAAQLADIIPQLREQAFQEYTTGYDMLNQNLKNLQGQDEIDYKRYLDMVNAEYQKERDAKTDEQQEWANAWEIYQKTGKITGPLKKVIKKTKASNSGGGGGGGSSGGGGSGGSGSSGSSSKKASTTNNTKANTTLTKTKATVEGDYSKTGSTAGTTAKSTTQTTSYAGKAGTTYKK